MYRFSRVLIQEVISGTSNLFREMLKLTRYLGFSITVLDKMRNVEKSMIKEICVLNVWR